MENRIIALKNKLIEKYSFILQKRFPGFYEKKFYTELFVKNENWNSKNPNHDEQLRWNVIEKLILQSNLQQNENRIIEIGCGRGWMSNLLSQYGKVIAFDPIKPVIDHAKKMFPSISFYSGTMHSLIKNNTLSKDYNLAVCSEVIEHIEAKDQIDFIGEIRSLLVNNGYLIITTPRKEILKYNSRLSNQPKEEWLSEKQLRELLISNDFLPFENIRIEMNYNNSAVPVYQVWMAKAL